MIENHDGPLEYYISGDPQSTTLLVFLQGWPDSMEMWDYITPDTLLGDFRLLRMNIPNHGNEKIPWGQNFEVLRDRIKATIDQVKGITDIVLVAHDWGCIYVVSYSQKYPKLLKHMIVMEVPAFLELSSIKAKLLFVAYQLWLIVSYLIGGSIGDRMTKYFSKISGHVPKYFAEIKSDRNFPYYYFWRNTLLAPFRKKEDNLDGYVPSVPVTYMFGTHKPAQFHGSKWLNYLKKNNGEFHSFEAGHWFMKKFKQPVVDIIKRRARL